MLEKINLNNSINEIKQLYDYKRIGIINDHMINIVKVENRTLDFHTHPDSDELFCVLEGSMKIELTDGLISLEKGDMLIVPKGVLHRPVVTVPVTCLQIEKLGTLNKENSGDGYKE